MGRDARRATHALLFHQLAAHPKLDPETGELFFFGYGMHNKPHFDYGVLDKVRLGCSVDMVR